MLKIKDNIDLKELEKYGIKYSLSYAGKFKGYGDKYQEIFIYEDRTISQGGHLDEMDLEKHDDILYDLIKDGLVVKVDNE